jgi:hypothetical protein
LRPFGHPSDRAGSAAERRSNDGLTGEETAVVLDVSRDAVLRGWQIA